jgi:hypothetical protein
MQRRLVATESAVRYKGILLTNAVHVAQAKIPFKRLGASGGGSVLRQREQAQRLPEATARPHGNPLRSAHFELSD